MHAHEKQLIFELALRRISEMEFVHRFPVDPRAGSSVLRQYLAAAIQDEDSDKLWAALVLIGTFGAYEVHTMVLADLLGKSWHKSHEDNATILQRLKDPGTVEALAAVAEAKFPYLDYDDCYAFGTKCIWALYAIGTPDAVSHLRKLAQSTNPIFRQDARERLDDLLTSQRLEKPGEPGVT